MKNNYLKRDNTSRTILWEVIISFLLSIACIVFELLCIRYYEIKKNANYSWLVISLTLITFAYCFLTLYAILSDKKTLFRFLISGYVFALFFLILLFILQRTGFFDIFSSREAFENYLTESGKWMPILYIVLQYLQVVILPIPGFVSTAAGVALFGPFKTLLCSFIGIVCGSITAFIIGRKFGYKVVCWIVGKDSLDKWLKRVKGKDYFILTAMFILPLFPDDILCFVAGLSSMTWQYFTIMIVLSRVLGIAATCYSVNFIPFNTWWGILIWLLIIVAVVGLFIILYKKMDGINRWFKKKFHKNVK